MAEDTGDISIDWITAEVSVARLGQQSLELRVALQTNPDNVWLHAFRAICKRHRRELRGAEGWDVTGPQSSYSPWITVGGIEPGSDEDAVKSGLQRLVDAANAQAPKERRTAEKEGRRRAEVEEAANEAARRMTERFREN
jgi:hypothetical protein